MILFVNIVIYQQAIVATAVFIGRSLGLQNAELAKNWVKYILMIFASFSFTLAIFVSFNKKTIASLITSNETIIIQSREYLAFIFPAYLPLNCLFMATNTALIAVQRVKQALYGIASLYLVFLPGIYFFAYYNNMKFDGVWLSLDVAVAIVSAIYLGQIMSFNWDNLL